MGVEKSTMEKMDSDFNGKLNEASHQAISQFTSEKIRMLDISKPTDSECNNIHLCSFQTHQTNNHANRCFIYLASDAP